MSTFRLFKRTDSSCTQYTIKILNMYTIYLSHTDGRTKFKNL